MEPTTPEELRRAPVGRFVVGPGCVVFCARSTLWGIVVWGSATAQAVRTILPVLERELDWEPHSALLDARRLERVEPDAFAAAGEFVTTHGARLGDRLRRVALVRPAGMAGAVVAGFFDVVPAPYEVGVFDELGPALELLGHPECAREIDELHQRVTGTTPVVTAVQAFLASNLVGPELPDAARALGLAERSLQRRLREAGTTFREQLAEARLRAAERMLLDTDAPLTAIAIDVGCASLQHFDQLFRRHRGEPPGAWRARRRGGAG
jgi:AraC-like DNA-binding protein